VSEGAETGAGEWRRLSLRVSAGASRSEILGRMADGRLKLRVAAPAEAGKANAEVVAFLARRLGLTRREVRLVAGTSSRDKVVEIKTSSERVRALGQERD
jgi:uncharacterized protein